MDPKNSNSRIGKDNSKYEWNPIVFHELEPNLDLKPDQKPADHPNQSLWDAREEFWSSTSKEKPSIAEGNVEEEEAREEAEEIDPLDTFEHDDKEEVPNEDDQDDDYDVNDDEE